MSNTTSSSNFTESTVVSVAPDEMAATILNESLRATFENLTRNLTNTVTEVIPVSDMFLNGIDPVQIVMDDSSIIVPQYVETTGPYGAQEYINIGDSPNDGTGDPLRVAFEKINNNFSTLFYTTTSVDIVYTTNADADQAIWEYLADNFTQCKIQIRSSDGGTNNSQDAMISAQITNDAADVKYTIYGVTFNGTPLTRYNMDVQGSSVRLTVTPLVNRFLTHFISSQVTFTGTLVPGVDIALDGFVDSVMTTEDDLILTTEGAL